MTSPDVRPTVEKRTEQIGFCSPTLLDFQLNPFRVLDLLSTAGADEAVWRAEERLTFLRAGLEPAEPTALSWMPLPGEPEIRQSLQVAEDPIRRLVARLTWFDFNDDPGGHVLIRLLESVCEVDVSRVWAEAEAGEQDLAGEPPASDGIVPVINRANLYLLLAGVAASECGPVVATTRPPSQATSSFRWEQRVPAAHAAVPGGEQQPASASVARESVERLPRSGIWSVSDPHHSFVGDGTADGNDVLAKAWRAGLKLWVGLLADSRFHEHLRSCLTELHDDVVGPDDDEVVVGILRMRLVDLLAAEVKSALLTGRSDRAGILLAAAQNTIPAPVQALDQSFASTAIDTLVVTQATSLSSQAEVTNGHALACPGIDRKLWQMALRSVRARLKAEAAELEVVLGPGPHVLDDIELYLDRIGALARRWATMDPTDMLGGREIADSAVINAINLLAQQQDVATITRVTGLLRRAALLAAADSIKQKASSAEKRLEEQRQFACHFCQTREMEHDCSVALRGKKLTHTTRSGNTTTNHYIIKYGITNRCQRCEELHQYLNWVGGTAWVVLAPLALFLGFVLFRPVYYWSFTETGPGSDVAWIPCLVGLGLLIVFIGAWVKLCWSIESRVADRLTPPGERRYTEASSSKQYASLKEEGYEVTVDFASGVLKRAARELKNLPTRT